jgi:p-cumate 2,3-dioxygenase beta subunit
MSGIEHDQTRSRVGTRLAVEEFVYNEAALLDAWDLDTWLTLFTEDCRYEVTPTGSADPFNIETRTTLFLIGDNRERLEQRVIRLNKPSAHVEFPKSKTRHLYTNVRIIEDTGSTVTAMVNFCTFRTKNRITNQYPGSIRYIFERDGETLRIKAKRVVLDLEALVPQGKVSIIL